MSDTSATTIKYITNKFCEELTKPKNSVHQLIPQNKDYETLEEYLDQQTQSQLRHTYQISVKLCGLIHNYGRVAKAAQ